MSDEPKTPEEIEIEELEQKTADFHKHLYEAFTATDDEHKRRRYEMAMDHVENARLLGVEAIKYVAPQADGEDN